MDADDYNNSSSAANSNDDGSGKRTRGRKAKFQISDNLTQQLQHADHPVILLPTGPVIDFTGVTLKPDHDRRPFWVTPSGRIFLEGTYIPHGKNDFTNVYSSR